MYSLHLPALSSLSGAKFLLISLLSSNLYSLINLLYDTTNVVLEKDGENRLGRWCEKSRRLTQSQGEEEYPTNNKWKDG
jgi:hypothetical protein